MTVYNILRESVFNIIDKPLSKGDYSFQLDFSGLTSGDYLLSYQTEYWKNILKMQCIK